MYLTRQEIDKHNSKTSCWVVIHGKVYDLTSFLPEHPGGSDIILKYAGRDATKAFDPIHPSDIIEKLLPASVCVGEIDPQEFKNSAIDEPKSAEEWRMEKAHREKPALSQMLNLTDFEAVR